MSRFTGATKLLESAGVPTTSIAASGRYARSDLTPGVRLWATYRRAEPVFGVQFTSTGMGVLEQCRQELIDCGLLPYHGTEVKADGSGERRPTIEYVRVLPGDSIGQAQETRRLRRSIERIVGMDRA